MRKRVLWLLVILVVLAVGLSVWRHWRGVPEDFANMEAEFKYGSIGSDHPRARAPIPYWIWKVLPEMFPPSTAIGDAEWYRPKNDKEGYAAFGLVTEANMARPRGVIEGQTELFERPIGFSKRTVFGIDFVGVNCAFCHTTTLRKTPGAKQEIVPGGTGNTVDIEQFFLYLFAATTNERFNTDDVMKKILGQKPDMNLLERFVYRVVIYFLPTYIAHLKKQFDFIAPNSSYRLPEFGPGRVDTWASYKRVFVDPPQHDKIPGIVDFPPIWNQKARVGMRMHWDGNTDVLEERNIISALALIGKSLDSLDFPRVTRISDWMMGLVPPRYEDRIPTTALPKNKPRIQWDLAERGKDLFGSNCAECHAPGGDRIGKVEPNQDLGKCPISKEACVGKKWGQPNEDLGTDVERIRAFTSELADALNRLGTDTWTLRNFKLQDGYVNTLLDGIWLRAPYLHNGSVPTLRDLLNEPARRPKRFCRGSDVYDWKNVGFVTPPMAGKKGAESCGEFFLYDTAVPGNSNRGHLYGTYLGEKEKQALIEFLKTL
ncbi:MAG: hypothetical protein ACREVT_07170 [Burkholderiales bacterium]